MKVPIKLLKEFIQIKETPEELAQLLTMHSMPVENISGMKNAIKNVVIGQIKTMTKHPNADKLRICQVDIGKNLVQILTAATNVEVGHKVPVAIVGAELADGFKIKEVVMRGEKSLGMLCSEKELGLAEQSEGILIFGDNAIVGKDIVEYLGMDEVVLEVEVIPNRSDCLSILGIARELAVILKRPLKEPKLIIPKKQSTSRHRASVNVKENQACPRYMAILMENVKVGPSPEWLQKHLKSAGIRPICNIVDVTNYVLIELGQPLHAFAFDKLEGGQINVRFAKDKEEIVTLDGKQRELNRNVLVIADKKNPQAIAGIMGGEGSEVNFATKTILLESAFFDPVLIRKTSKMLGLASESSHRFAKGVDWKGVQNALYRAVHLIKETAGGEIVSEIFDKKKKDPMPQNLFLRMERASQLLGLKVSEMEVVDILRSLGFTVNSLGDRVDVIVPSWRASDITREIDLVEEVARIIGYNKIPSTLPKKQIVPQAISIVERASNAIKSVLLASGLNEVMTYSLTSPLIYQKIGVKDDLPLEKDIFNFIEIENPLSQELAVLRNSILPELIHVLARNWAHQTYDIKIFEAGIVFYKQETENKKQREVLAPKEVKNIAGIICGDFLTRPWQNIKENDVDFYTIKGIIENIFNSIGIKKVLIKANKNPLFHPGKSAAIEGVGSFGAIHPSILRKMDILKEAYAFELNIEELAKLASFDKSQKYIPKLPYSRRDVAFLIPEKIPFSEVEQAIKSIASNIIDDFYLFDRYHGPQVKQGFVSLACAVHYQGKDKTLTDNEVDSEHKKVVNVLKEKLGAEIRS
ncbi:MAG: phenylalanine--tRNA ligase subunit beta [Candidatus Margulisbacteria bacterium]|nr:phenylalanine--tRNA ligase subunit beta [Candidatus Margulisiibacteriota bacterium]